jgi:hypothetical protein
VILQIPLITLYRYAPPAGFSPVEISGETDDATFWEDVMTGKKEILLAHIPINVRRQISSLEPR